VTLYVVCVVQTQIEVAANFPLPCLSGTVPLAWSDGQVGAMPVFARREDAERYADGRLVLTVETIEAKEEA